MFLDSELLVKFRTFKTWVGRCHVTRDKWHVKSPWASIDPSYLEFVKGMSCLASGPIDKIWGVEQFLTFYPQRPKLNQKKCLECRELILFVQSVTLSGVFVDSCQSRVHSAPSAASQACAKKTAPLWGSCRGRFSNMSNVSRSLETSDFSQRNNWL